LQDLAGRALNESVLICRTAALRRGAILILYYQKISLAPINRD